MNILHTEESCGWGGQEMRILSEAIGMRKRGHTLIFAINQGGKLVDAARKEGFLVYELPFHKKSLIPLLSQLNKIVKKHQINLINTHSSLDSWATGFLGKIKKIPVIRTRHLSTPIKKGLNSKLLYNFLADVVVTTCQEVVPIISEQAGLNEKRCLSIPTGVDVEKFQIKEDEVLAFRKKWGVKEDEILIGTLCILRVWKGIKDLLHAAKLLESYPKLRWMVIGGGVSEELFLNLRKELGLTQKVIFTGYLSNPEVALASLDIFTLLSFANEGVSQAALQAAWLKKPLITTETGGLKEICLHEKSGLIVQPKNPIALSDAVLKMAKSAKMRQKMGEKGHSLVQKQFTLEKMLDKMEEIYRQIS